MYTRRMLLKQATTTAGVFRLAPALSTTTTTTSKRFLSISHGNRQPVSATTLTSRTLQSTLIGRRTLVTKKSPGPNPLQRLQKDCLDRNLCDEKGGRLPGVHWVVALAIPHIQQPELAPNLRTIGVQRVTEDGIDFVMKRGTKTSNVLEQGHRISLLHSHGKYLMGESAEQWRGEGICIPIPLSQVLDLLPHYTITSMIGSKRLEAEDDATTDDAESGTERFIIPNKSHYTEIMQKTRIELENGDLSLEEMEDAITAFRFQPERMECLLGSPDSIAWDRWEWVRDSSTQGDGVLSWEEPMHLLPH